MILKMYATSGNIKEYEEKLQNYHVLFGDEFDHVLVKIEDMWDLLNISRDTGREIIISNQWHDKEPYLELYDDYRE